MIRVGCAIIKNSYEQVLIVQRSAEMPHPFSWEFPGGKIREDESPGEAVVREIREELQLEVIAGQELQPVVWEYPDKKIALVGVICEIRSGELRLQEHMEARWSELDGLQDLDMLAADLLIIQQLKGEQ